jgi:hypothetical protein
MYNACDAARTFFDPRAIAVHSSTHFRPVGRQIMSGLRGA